jgi:hypothetical protein
MIVRRDVVIRRNVIKPDEFCIVLLSVRFHGGQILRHAYTAGIGYATRDEAVQAYERNTWM